MHEFTGEDFVAFAHIAVTDTECCAFGSFREYTFQHSETPLWHLYAV